MLPGAASGPGPPLHILGFFNKTAATLHSHWTVKPVFAHTKKYVKKCIWYRKIQDTLEVASCPSSVEACQRSHKRTIDSRLQPLCFCMWMHQACPSFQAASLSSLSIETYIVENCLFRKFLCSASSSLPYLAFPFQAYSCCSSSLGKKTTECRWMQASSGCDQIKDESINFTWRLGHTSPDSLSQTAGHHFWDHLKMLFLRLTPTSFCRWHLLWAKSTACLWPLLLVQTFECWVCTYLGCWAAYQLRLWSFCRVSAQSAKSNRTYTSTNIYSYTHICS